MNTLTISRAPNKCRPIQVATYDSATGNRLGGNPPEGIYPATEKRWIQYLASLGVGDQPDLELSFFLVGDSPSDVWKNCFHLMSGSTGPLHIVLHPAVGRSASIASAPAISGHALIVGDEITDLVDQAGAADHKLGGTPYYHHNYKQSIIRETQSALESGYFHFLQLSMPVYRDARVKGNWPFGEYVFHVFAKELGSGWEFLYGWA